MTTESSTKGSLELPSLRDNIENFHRIVSRAYQPEEFRSNVKLWGSGLLALSLWILLGCIAWSHFQATNRFAEKLSSHEFTLEEGRISLIDQEKVQMIDKASEMVDSTANSLYTFLTPVITAVTGYFFVASGAKPRAMEESIETTQEKDSIS